MPIENDFLRSKLKTHFIKNAMQSIDGFVQRGQGAEADAAGGMSIILGAVTGHMARPPVHTARCTFASAYGGF